MSKTKSRAKNTRDGAQVLRIVLAFTFRHWQRRWWLAAAVAIGQSCATITEIFVPLYVGHLVDALGRGAMGHEAALAAFGAIVALGAAMVVLRHVSWWAIVPLTLRIMRDIANEAFHRVQRFSTDWHANAFSGSTVRKITRGMWALDTLDDTLLLMLLPSLVVLIGTVVMLGWHWPVMGLVMGIGAVAYVALTVILSTRVIAPASRLSNQWDTKIGGVLADAIGTNAVVKAFGSEEREEARLARTVAKWSRRTQRTWMLFTYAGTAQLSLLWTVRTAVTGTALWLWWQGRATPGDIAYVLTTYLVLHGYLREIGQYVHQLQRSVNEMEELVQIHEQPLGIEDAADARPIRIEEGAIRFEHVTFHYGGHATPLYEALDVAIPAGQRVGLVGPSGSGKTTFVKLIQRLYDVTDGRVTIDGQDVAHATQAEIEQAARLANAHDFITRLPKGYRTPVGERGVKLSGGERQRVALARAFLADAPILILDEATSSLDSESEAAITEAMARLMLGRTTVIIAHRLSTVRTLDRILVFDNGMIVEDDDHLALLAIENGRYRRLFERQSGGKAAESLL